MWWHWLLAGAAARAGARADHHLGYTPRVHPMRQSYCPRAGATPKYPTYPGHIADRPRCAVLQQNLAGVPAWLPVRLGLGFLVPTKDHLVQRFHKARLLLPSGVRSRPHVGWCELRQPRLKALYFLEFCHRLHAYDAQRIRALSLDFQNIPAAHRRRRRQDVR